MVLNNTVEISLHAKNIDLVLSDLLCVHDLRLTLTQISNSMIQSRCLLNYHGQINVASNVQQSIN